MSLDLGGWGAPGTPTPKPKVEDAIKRQNLLPVSRLCEEMLTKYTAGNGSSLSAHVSASRGELTGV
jgi:hypothetical protein